MATEINGRSRIAMEQVLETDKVREILASSGDMILPEQWSDDLQCHWIFWLAGGAGKLLLMLPEHNCCDMSGAIKVATCLMPNVVEVVTFSGRQKDTVYRKMSAGWVAHRVPVE